MTHESPFVLVPRDAGMLATTLVDHGFIPVGKLETVRRLLANALVAAAPGAATDEPLTGMFKCWIDETDMYYRERIPDEELYLPPDKSGQQAVAWELFDSLGNGFFTKDAGMASKWLHADIPGRTKISYYTSPAAVGELVERIKAVRDEMYRLSWGPYTNPGSMLEALIAEYPPKSP